MAAVQIARALGAKVVAVARGPDKMTALKAAGADFCIDSDTLHEADGVGGRGLHSCTFQLNLSSF